MKSTVVRAGSSLSRVHILEMIARVVIRTERGWKKKPSSVQRPVLEVNFDGQENFCQLVRDPDSNRKLFECESIELWIITR